jgi:hypothetical protein
MQKFSNKSRKRKGKRKGKEEKGPGVEFQPQPKNGPRPSLPLRTKQYPLPFLHLAETQAPLVRTRQRLQPLSKILARGLRDLHVLICTIWFRFPLLLALIKPPPSRTHLSPKTLAEPPPGCSQSEPPPRSH